MNLFFNCEEDYYSSRVGFVIEGKKLSSIDAASKYLIDNVGMEPQEASGYLRTLQKEAKKRQEVCS